MEAFLQEKRSADNLQLENGFVATKEGVLSLVRQRGQGLISFTDKALGDYFWQTGQNIT